MTIVHKAPGKFPRRRVRIITTAALLLSAFCSLALADDPIFHVARISLVEGEVSYKQAKDSGDSGKDWFDASLNLPLEENDQLYSGSDGRAEIQLSGRNVVRINHDTNLRFTQFKPGAIQMALPIGSAYFRIDSLDKRQFDVVDANDPGIDDPVYFEIDTPTVAVTFVKEGVYRINVRDDGSTEVIVRQGEAEVYNQEIDTTVVKKDRRVVVEGRGDIYQINGLEGEDDWDRWNDARDKGLNSSLASSASADYIPEAIPGAYDLDSYGEWIDTEEYGRMWTPRGVDNDWAPYRDGCWRWFPSYGWTWVSYEPWGWAPYHYGRWAYVRDRWCWAPFININTGSDWRWRPHHVAFFGWGGDYSRGYRDGYYDGYWTGFRDGRYGWLGWCPLSPRDRRYGPRDNAPRFEALGNFRARGGVSGMDARNFTGGRVLVSRSLLNAPVPHGVRGERGFAAPAFVRNEDLRPLQRITPTRSDAVFHGRGARRFEAPIVFRRNPVNGAFSGPRPNRDGRDNRDGHDGRDGRDERRRDGQRPSAPIGRGSESNSSEPGRNPNNRGDRPWRTPDYKPPERVGAPPPRSRESRESREPGESRDRSEKRDGDSRERMNGRARDNDGSPARSEGPRRDERRSDDAPRRPDPPDRPNFERRESPRQGDERRETRRPDPPSHDNSPREMRRPDPPPSRDNSPRQEMRRPDPPPRAPERQSSPPPQSAPSRAPERPSSPPPAPAARPSSPPARESPPSRPAERPAERSGPRRP
jgi:hypothetical protein